MVRFFILELADNFSCFEHAARPEDHQKNWLEMIKCISPNATYLNINVGQNICRNTANWCSTYSHTVIMYTY